MLNIAIRQFLDQFCNITLVFIPEKIKTILCKTMFTFTFISVILPSGEAEAYKSGKRLFQVQADRAPPFALHF